MREIHVTGEFTSQRPVTRSFDVFFDLRMIKRLSNQSWGCWFETPSLSLWRHCNDVTFILTRFSNIKSNRNILYLTRNTRNLSIRFACIAKYHNLSKANYSANFRMPLISWGNRNTAHMYWNNASQTSKLSPVLTEILLQEVGTTFLIMAMSDSQYIPPRNIIQTKTIDCEFDRLEHTKQRPMTNDGVYTSSLMNTLV